MRKIKITGLLFFILPIEGKLFSILASLSSKFYLQSIPLHIIFLPLIMGVVVSLKVLFFGSYVDLLWIFKPFSLIPGYYFGINFVRNNYPLKYFNGRTSFYISLIILFITMIQFSGLLDIWSGSGSFLGRSTGGFRGFGELALITYFLSLSVYNIPALTIVFLLSSSKLVALSIILGLLVSFRNILTFKTFTLFSFFSIFVFNIFSSIESIENSIFQNFYWSVIDCGADCSSYTTRIESTLILLNSFSSPIYLLIGDISSDVFVVQPEIGFLYYAKLYGIPLSILIFAYLLFFLRKNLKVLPILVIPFVDVYGLSFISYFIFGFLICISNLKKTYIF